MGDTALVVCIAMRTLLFIVYRFAIRVHAVRTHDGDRFEYGTATVYTLFAIILSKSRVYYAVSNVVLTPENCDFHPSSMDESIERKSLALVVWVVHAISTHLKLGTCVLV